MEHNDTHTEINTSRVIPVDLGEEIKKSFISYAMAVIINRALPDVRDGLKPVHRRILYSMGELGLTPDKAYKKCARIVGDVLGKYHPHGDTAIYDSLVRMAQDFSTRYLLVDGHGNFGSVDGDSAAAMRYTEARLAKISMEMLADIDKDTVDFYPNFDDSLEQPVTLPSRYPNLLVNGTGGIAVGMATNIPPHNLKEVVGGTVALIDNPDMSIEELMELIPGPDFPTGGLVMGISGIRQAYRTGRGKIRLRARAEIESEKDGERIVITEIPYQVNKEALVTNIRELAADKKIDGISGCNDESDKTGMRVVVDLKRGANASIVLNRLYKHTQMQTTFGTIMIALVDGEPRCLNIKEVLSEYIKYQREIIVRRTKYDLERALKRAHILEGLLRALDVIDEIIETIRASKDGAAARYALMEGFEFTEIQAQAILDMKLQRLTGLEHDRLQGEYDELMDKIDYFNRVLSTPSMVDDIIKTDLIAISDKYGDARRTTITFDESEIDYEELIQEEDMVVTLTHYGYVKRVSTDTYKSQRRGGKGITGLSTREEDFVQDAFVTSTHNRLLFFTNTGRVYTMKCYQIPEASRQAKGTAIVNLLQLDAEERITSVFPVEDFEQDCDLMMITKMGVVKKTHLGDFTNIRQNGIIAINLRDEDRLVRVFKVTLGENVIIGTKHGMSITFCESDVRRMGRTATGVRGISLRGRDRVVDMCPLDSDKDVLIITENGYGKRTGAEEYRVQTRGGIGVKTLNLTVKTGEMCGLVMTTGEEDLMLVSDANVIIRMSTSEVSHIGRAAQGVKLMRIEEGSKVVTVALLPESEQEDDFNDNGDDINDTVDDN